MSVVAAESHAHHGGHAHHWETSVAPMAIMFGVLFLVPLTFISFLCYGNINMAIACAGIGTPILIFGISRWVAEGIATPNLVVGAAGTGLPLFIVSEICIFLSLFASYWMLRLFADSWPPAGTPEMPVDLPLLMTVLLVTSSFTIHKGEELLEHGDLPGFRKWLLITIVLGTAFLSCTIYEYSHLIGHGFVPGTNIFSTAFFSLTGFHASHVLVGIGAFVFVLIPALSGKTNKTLVNCVSVYWHFVDIVWFFVVSQIYFW
ncbi:MAG: heme-copper oxidase subunit III [Rhodospirillaceae bacterium]